MWLLVSASDKEVRYSILGDHKYVVGRQSCDIVIPDASVSRKQAVLTMAHYETSVVKSYITPTLTLEDVSKFGTFVNGKIVKNTGGSTITLKHNDEIKFGGSPSSVFKAIYEPFIATTSCLEKAPKKSLHKIMCLLGGHLVRDWRPTCDLLIMSKINVTIKVICAINNQKHIVTPQYLDDLYSHLMGRREKPDPVSYLPEVVDQEVPPGVSFHPDIRRMTLLQGLKFYFLSALQFNKTNLAVSTAGGQPILLEDGTEDEAKTMAEERTVVVAVSREILSTLSPSCQKFVKLVVSALRRKNLRMVTDPEIGWAILTCNTVDFCNARSSITPGMLSSVATQSMSQATEVDTTQHAQLAGVRLGKRPVTELIIGHTSLSEDVKPPTKIIKCEAPVADVDEQTVKTEPIDELLEVNQAETTRSVCDVGQVIQAETTRSVCDVGQVIQAETTRSVCDVGQVIQAETTGSVCDVGQVIQAETTGSVCDVGQVIQAETTRSVCDVGQVIQAETTRSVCDVGQVIQAETTGSVCDVGQVIQAETTGSVCDVGQVIQAETTRNVCDVGQVKLGSSILSSGHLSLKTSAATTRSPVLEQLEEFSDKQDKPILDSHCRHPRSENITHNAQNGNANKSQRRLNDGDNPAATEIDEQDEEVSVYAWQQKRSHTKTRVLNDFDDDDDDDETEETRKRVLTRKSLNLFGDDDDDNKRGKTKQAESCKQNTNKIVDVFLESIEVDEHSPSDVQATAQPHSPGFVRESHGESGERKSCHVTKRSASVPGLCDDGWLNMRTVKSRSSHEPDAEQNEVEDDVKPDVELLRDKDGKLLRNLCQVEVAELVSRPTVPRTKIDSLGHGRQGLKNFKKFRKTQHVGAGRLPVIIGGRDLEVYLGTKHKDIEDLFSLGLAQENRRQENEKRERELFNWDDKARKASNKRTR